MKIDYLKGKSGFISVLLLGASSFSAILTTVKVTSLFAASAKAENLVKTVVSQNKKDAEDSKKYLAINKALADGLKKNNLFAPAPPKKHPVKEVLGILGDEVLIRDKWYKLGDKVAEATIVAVGPTEVRIEWQGREQVFAPINGSSSEQSSPGSPRTRVTTAKKEIRTEQAEMVVVGLERRGQGGKRPPEKLSEKERAKLQLKAEQKLLTDMKKYKKLTNLNAENIKDKQKVLTGMQKHMKLSYLDAEKIKAGQKKNAAKMNGPIKTKKELNQKKTKK